MSLDFLIWLGLAFVGILVAFTVHEYAHARAAYALGDPVPKYEGRLTLNPIVHLDPVGALVLLVTLAASQGRVVVGWGKPVRFDSDNLRDPIRDGALIALAGPASNFVLASLAGLPVRFGLVPVPLLQDFLVAVAAVNVAMGLFNLIPFPPLDGWKILQAFVPRSFAWDMKSFEVRAGMAPLFILMAFLFLFGGAVLGPPYQFLMAVFAGRLPLQ